MSMKCGSLRFNQNLMPKHVIALRKFAFPFIVPVQIWAAFKRLPFHVSHCWRAMVWYKRRLFGYQTYHFIMQHITGICCCGAIDILWQKVISVAWTTSRRFNGKTCEVFWSIWQVNFDQGCRHSLPLSPTWQPLCPDPELNTTCWVFLIAFFSGFLFTSNSNIQSDVITRTPLCLVYTLVYIYKKLYPPHHHVHCWHDHDHYHHHSC